MFLKKILFVILLYTGFFAYGVQDSTFNAGLQKLKEEKTDSGRVRQLGRLSYMYQYEDFNKSIYYADTALKLAKKINNPLGIAKSYNFLGLAYSSTGKLDLALQCYLQALNQNKNAGNERESAKNLNNIGEVLITIRDFNEAEKYILEAYKINTKYDNKNSLAITLSLMADIYLGNKHYDQALAHLNEARKLKNDDREIFDAGYYNAKLGKIYLQKGNLDSAKIAFEKVINYKNPERDQLINAYSGLAIIKSRENRLMESKAYLNKALQIAQHAHAQVQLISVFEELIKLSVKMNDLPATVSYMDKKDSLKNDLLGFTTSGQISSSLNKIITDQKDRENEALRLETQFKEKAISKQKTLLIVLIIGIAISLMLGFIAFINNQKKNKAYKKLDKANQIILRHNANLEQMIEKRTETISQKNAKLKEVAYFNSHRVRKHIANILGLLHVASFETEKDEFFNLIEYEAKSLDETLSQINQMTND